jgi:uncharacterized NAD-dependent epimerase/dehydratase family protein
MLRKPYLIFLGSERSPALSKTAFGIRDWLPDDTVAQWSMPGCQIDLGIPTMTPEQAYAAGARSLLIGVASIGGKIPEAWIPSLVRAMDAGLDIVSGLHTRLSSIPELAQAAEWRGRELHDVRHSDRQFPIGTGRKRSGRRLLTVGTDCALGKKYTALTLAKALQARGVPADFRATGQTGIMIAGDGVAIDAVVADFIAGAAESLSPDAAAGHWDVIEGQGSLFHPGYASVTLGLLHGSQPDALVLCHDPLRITINEYPDYPLPPLAEAVQTYLAAGRLTNPAVRFVGVSLNTSKLDDAAAAEAAGRVEEELGLPCFDPLRFGVEAVVDQLLAVA